MSCCQVRLSCYVFMSCQVMSSCQPIMSCSHVMSCCSLFCQVVLRSVMLFYILPCCSMFPHLATSGCPDDEDDVTASQQRAVDSTRSCQREEPLPQLMRHFLTPGSITQSINLMSKVFYLSFYSTESHKKHNICTWKGDFIYKLDIEKQVQG